MYYHSRMNVSTPVLIVDDLEPLREMVETFLAEMDRESHSVGTVAAAKNWLAGNVPPLIILDVTLPDGNGLDACRWIRSQPGLEKTPILIMTAITDDKAIRDAFELGAIDHIEKPVEFAAFRGKIARFLSGAGLPAI